MKGKNIIVLCVIATVIAIAGIGLSIKYFTIGKVKGDDATDETFTAYTYKSDLNAESIQIDKAIKLYKNKGTLANLEIIRNKLIEEPFNGIKIDIKGIGENSILTIDLIDAEKKVVEYLDAGSAGSKIYMDILTNSFLQPEADTEDWINGLKILLNGEANVEGNHFSLNRTFYRNPTEKTLAYITDYGYGTKVTDFEEKFLATPTGQNFVIEPKGKDTTIIIKEVEYTENGFVEGKELYRTNKKLLFVMELPEGAPYIEVKVTNGDKSSTWFPSYNGKDETLIVPEGFEIRSKEATN